ncbi:MAG: hypothetical protein SFU83_11060 [Meiothermus sp.]|nr:hypothetical protein [Meiothermus sp.]
MPTHRQGIALIAALVFAFIIFIMVAIGTVSSYSNRENAAAALNTTRAQLAAEAGLDKAVDMIWHQVWAQSPTTVKNLDNYKNLLQSRGISATYDATTTANLSGGGSYSVRIRRQDQGNTGLGGGRSVMFALESTGSLGAGNEAAVRKLTQTLRIGADFPDNYALLTRSVSCTFCHASFQSIDALGGPASATDPWKITSVGVMEMLQSRSGAGEGDSDTVIHGNLLSRGRTADWDLDIGSVIDGGLSSTLTTTLVAGQTQITSNSQSSLSSQATDCSTISNCPKDSNLVYYRNYPTQKPAAGWPAGELPSEFPKPIPDTNGNNLVDAAEWSSFVANVTDKGTLRASTKGYTNTTLSWGGTSFSTLSSGEYNGNLLIDGTSQASELDGTIYVNGDVVIRGQLKGRGRIVARGNVYVMGNTTYNCGTGPCADAEYDQSNANLPEFSVVAGGNIIIGDHSHPGWNPNAAPADLDPTFTQCASYPARTISCSSSMSFTNRQLADFNRLELIKYFESGGTYRPRFYSRTSSETLAFVPSEPGEPGGWNQFAPIEVGSVIDLGRPVSGVSCDTSSGGCRVTLTAAMLSGNLAAAVGAGQLLPLAESSALEANLRQLWKDSVDAGYVNGGGEGLRFDGLMYSANSIFTIMSRRLNTNSASNRGLIDIRGAILAADTGILAPGPGGGAPGLKIYHDYRLRPEISSNRVEVSLSRSIQQLVRR